MAKEDELFWMVFVLVVDSKQDASSFDVLRELGLTDNEAKTFLAMCGLGPSSASEVAEAAGVHRSLAYGVLARLIEKGFASQVTRDGKKVFQAVTPEHLKVLFLERNKRVESELDGLVGSLSKVYRASRKPGAEIFTGLEGLRTVFSEELAGVEEGGEILYYRAQPLIARVLEVFIAKYHKSRIEKGVSLKAILDCSPDSLEQARELAKMPLTEVRLLPDATPTPITHHIFGDCIDIMSLSGKESISILIKGNEISSFFRSSFEFSWDKLEPFSESKF